MEKSQCEKFLRQTSDKKIVWNLFVTKYRFIAALIGK